MIGLLFWIALCAAVGWMARERGRDPYLWGFLSFVLSPLVGSVALLVVGELE